MSNQNGKTSVQNNTDVSELIKNSLRKAPHVVGIGEVRGGELEELIRAMSNCNKKRRK